MNRKSLWALVAGAVLVLGVSAGPQQGGDNGDRTASARTVTVGGEVALHSLISLSDGHLQKIADVYSILAGMDSVRSADWRQVREQLKEASRVNVPALYWFALPDGTYWSLDEGRVEANLTDRAYFPRVVAGKTVIGDLVVSKATGKSVAIVAVPVRGDDSKVVGVLGASVYLDSLSKKIRQEMRLTPDHVFFSLNAEPIVGLHMDPQTIFVHPLDEDDPQLASAIREILSRDEGIVSYRFRGERRTIHYHRSPVTGWWYAFGEVHD